MTCYATTRCLWATRNFGGESNSFGNKLTFEGCKNLEGKFDFDSKSMPCTQCDKSSAELIVFAQTNANSTRNAIVCWKYLTLSVYDCVCVFTFYFELLKCKIYDNVQTEFAISWCRQQWLGAFCLLLEYFYLVCCFGCNSFLTSCRRE